MKLYYTLFTEGLDAIARHYIRQQADDPTAHDRWQSEFDRLCDDYSGHLQGWAVRPMPAHHPDEYRDGVARFDENRLAADDLTLGEFESICRYREGCAALYPAMQAAAAVEGREGWSKVFAHYCPTVEQRQAAFTKFAKLAQAVLDADPATLPRLDIGLAPVAGWTVKPLCCRTLPAGRKPARLPLISWGTRTACSCKGRRGPQ